MRLRSRQPGLLDPKCTPHPKPSFNPIAFTPNGFSTPHEWVISCRESLYCGSGPVAGSSLACSFVDVGFLGFRFNGSTLEPVVRNRRDPSWRPVFRSCCRPTLPGSWKRELRARVAKISNPPKPRIPEILNPNYPDIQSQILRYLL